MTFERTVVAIDLESTGTDPVLDRIIELGVTVMTPDGARARWCQRFNPGIPIPVEATEVHGITNVDVATMPAFKDFAGRIHRSLEGRDLIGYNLRRMDLPMLDEEFRRCGLKLNLDGVRVIDAFGIFSKKAPRKLEDAVRRFCGREHEGSHGAAADAEATLDVLLGQLAEFDDLAAMTIDQLADYSQTSEVRYADLAGKLYYDQDGEIRYAFGKHKDCLVKEQRGYAHWMINKAGGFPSSTLDVLEAIIDQPKLKEEPKGLVDTDPLLS